MAHTRTSFRAPPNVIVTLVVLILGGLAGCGGGSEPTGESGALASTADHCAGFTSEAVDLTQASLDAIDDPEKTRTSSTEQAAMDDLMERALDGGCVRSMSDFPSLVCPGVDELIATSDAAIEGLAGLTELCDWSPDPAAVGHPALMSCVPAVGEAVVLPIQATEGDGVFAAALDPLLEEGFRHADERFEFRDGAAARSLNVNTAADGALQSLILEVEGGVTAWREFRWDDPVWSERSESEPWSSREEPGAFEPSYAFGFLAPVHGPTSLAGSPDLEPVFETVVEHGGIDLPQFCIDGAAGLSFGPSSGLAATRFLAHPDGYVVEFVEASVGSYGRFCYQSTLEIGADIELPDLENSPPPEHVDLAVLPGCADLVEGG